jgi:hypothetical protein
MRQIGLQGVVRGKSTRTTVSDAAAPCPRDWVDRPFKAPRPNALWVSDFTFVASGSGFVYVAFVIAAVRPPGRGLAREAGTQGSQSGIRSTRRTPAHRLASHRHAFRGLEERQNVLRSKY